MHLCLHMCVWRLSTKAIKQMGFKFTNNSWVKLTQYMLSAKRAPLSHQECVIAYCVGVALSLTCSLWCDYSSKWYRPRPRPLSCGTVDGSGCSLLVTFRSKPWKQSTEQSKEVEHWNKTVKYTTTSVLHSHNRFEWFTDFVIHFLFHFSCSGSMHFHCGKLTGKTSANHCYSGQRQALCTRYPSGMWFVLKHNYR